MFRVANFAKTLERNKRNVKESFSRSITRIRVQGGGVKNVKLQVHRSERQTDRINFFCLSYFHFGVFSSFLFTLF